MQRIRSISIDQSGVEAESSGLVRGPEVEDESREVEVEDEGDSPFEDGGDGFDDARSSCGTVVGVPDASADDAVRGGKEISEREMEGGRISAN